jgi:hypothetical protein
MPTPKTDIRLPRYIVDEHGTHYRVDKMPPAAQARVLRQVERQRQQSKKEIR